MSGDSIKSDPETRNMIDYVDDRYEKGRVSHVLRGWRKAIKRYKQKIQQATIEDDTLVRFSLLAPDLSNNVGGYIKL